MKDTYTISTLIKFGSKEDMTDLFENGTIYMNPINYFRKFEDNQLRGDKYEGVKNIWNYPSGIFEIQAINFKGRYESLHLLENYENVYGNIYSMYSISTFGFDNLQNIDADERIKNFGTHFVYIRDLRIFFNRIRSSLKLTGLKHHEGFVHYYDKEKANGRISVFQKPLEFEYQKEFRFYLERMEITPFSFRIGSLKSIAQIEEIKKRSR